jgi:peptidoglycan/xylan/chitin deacetylase (PgdA/CDA1 family)
MPILGYHRIVDAPVPGDEYNLCMTRERFERQMGWFARFGWRTLSLEAVADYLARGERIPPRHFAITFDDGYVDTFTHAWPILRRFGFTATVFVVAGRVGQRSVWDGDKPWVAPLMSWEQVAESMRMGFSVGSHTMTHPHLGQIPLDDARRELVASRRIHEERLGTPIRTFCYPHGDWTDAVVREVAAAGYTLACNNLGRLEHGAHIFARTDPGYWPTVLTPLVRCQPWYFEAHRRGVLHAPRRLAAIVRSTVRRSPRSTGAAA